MKKTFSITLNVTIDVDKATNGRRIPRISFKGWKHGVVNKQNRFIDTEAIVQKTDKNMQSLGTQLFDAAKEMFDEDEDLA
jgi:plasmid replication initiation protein